MAKLWVLLLCAAVLANAHFTLANNGDNGNGNDNDNNNNCRGDGRGALPTKYGLLATGDLTTVDEGGPYYVPQVQQAEVQAAIAAKAGRQRIYDSDVLNFLANTECFEARFDSFAAFGHDMPEDLLSYTGTGYGRAIGGRKAKLSNQVQSWIEEVALDEQGHVRLIRDVLRDRSVPCPVVDIDIGFTKFFDAAVGKTSSPRFDCYKDDINFLLCVWSVEEIGATGDQGSIALMSNPGLAASVAGLACSASYQAAVDRQMLWERRNYTVPEYGLKVWEIVQKVSDLRDLFDGPLEVDQGLYNFDKNYIAVPTLKINNVPTDYHGVTFARTPKQVLRILTLGSDNGRGGYFPEGVHGKITNTIGYADQANGFAGYKGNKVTVRTLAEAGRANLLNNGVIIPARAPQPLQDEASGVEYGSGFDITNLGTGLPIGPYADTFEPRS